MMLEAFLFDNAMENKAEWTYLSMNIWLGF